MKASATRTRKYTTTPRVCEVCEATFDAWNRTQRYCSYAHARLAYNARVKGKEYRARISARPATDPAISAGWIADIHQRHPVPDLPPPTDPSPAFWDFRSHWDAAMAFAGWVTGADWQASLTAWVLARSVRP